MANYRHLKTLIYLTRLENDFQRNKKIFDTFKNSKTYCKLQKYFRTRQKVQNLQKHLEGQK